MSSFGNTIANMYGYAKTEIPEEEYDQLSFVEDVPKDCWTKEEKMKGDRMGKKLVYLGREEIGAL